MLILFLLLLLLCSAPAHSSRVLHEPFFPLSSSPPSPSPTSPSSSSSSIPKYPSSSSNSSSSSQPFFPLDPASPPPPSSSLPTFPANISSLIFPSSNSPASHSSPSKLIAAILLPLLSLSALAAILAFFLHRRHAAAAPATRSESRRLFPPDTAGSDGRKLSPTRNQDFLYLGTLVNSRRRADDVQHENLPSSSASSPYHKLDSPELRPLPPLSRELGRCYNNADGGCSSSEEFYSPRGSSAGKDGSGISSSSTRVARAAALEKSASRSSNLSTPSYPSSPSSPAAASSPSGSTAKSRSARSNLVVEDIEIQPLPPPPPPPLPRFSLQPLTPSPPKRKPASPSPLSSPPENNWDKNARKSDSSGSFLQSPGRIRDFDKSRSAAAPPLRQPAPPPPPVPPPPPPPPVGYWESHVRKPRIHEAPVLTPPRSTGFKNSNTAVFPAESPETSDSNEKSEENHRPKLKPLHWDKVRASSDRAMVWDQLKASSFQLNEEMIEKLFVCNATNTAPTTEMNKRQVLPLPNHENRVLDPKKSQNIAILLRALNVTKEEVCDALLEGNTDSLGTELLETLVRMGPTKEEELKLKQYKDDSPIKLGPAEKFLKAVVDIPFAFKRIEAMLYIANFDSEVNYLKKSFDTLEAACEELRTSRLFLKLLEAVLKTGNRMNVGTNRGDARAFKLDTLLKLVDVKGTDGKTTLLHFVVQEIIRAEGSRMSAASPTTTKVQPSTLRDDLEHKKLGLQVVAGLGGELSNVKKAAAMDSDVLGSYVSKLAGGIGKVNDVIRLNETSTSSYSNQRFHEAMNGFLKKAEDEIIKVQAQESVALSLVKEITEYFHGNSAKEEAHPFRIFMVVRDFLSTLDQVCKEVGKINDRSIASSQKQFPVPVNPTLPPLFPMIHALRPESSDDESSSSS